MRADRRACGLDVKFDETDHTISSVTTDNTRMHELIGPAEIDWRDGITRMITPTAEVRPSR